MQPTVAVLGAGAMGEAIIRGLLQAGWDPEQVTAADPATDRLELLGGPLGIVTTTDPAAAVGGRDVIAVVVKPNHVGSVIDQIAGVVTPEQIVLSLAAGIPIATYESGLPGLPVVRAMPNTPALLGAGAAAIAAGTHARSEHMDAARAILGAVGTVAVVEESLMDAVTAVSGSGPAYVFLLSEAMQAAARDLGLGEDVARVLVNQTILGAGRMLAETGTDADVLRQRVTSPGGTTAAALHILEAGGFRALLHDAISAAEARGRELGTET